MAPSDYVNFIASLALVLAIIWSDMEPALR